jgi:hypothetical protein
MSNDDEMTFEEIFGHMTDEELEHRLKAEGQLIADLQWLRSVCAPYFKEHPGSTCREAVAHLAEAERSRAMAILEAHPMLEIPYRLRSDAVN